MASILVDGSPLGQHVTEELMEAYVLSRIDSLGEEGIEEHYLCCLECAQRLESTQRLIALLKTAKTPSVRVTSERSCFAAARRKWHIEACAAATLAAAVLIPIGLEHAGKEPAQLASTTVDLPLDPISSVNYRSETPLPRAVSVTTTREAKSPTAKPRAVKITRRSVSLESRRSTREFQPPPQKTSIEEVAFLSLPVLIEVAQPKGLTMTIQPNLPSFRSKPNWFQRFLSEVASQFRPKQS